MGLTDSTTTVSAHAEKEKTHHTIDMNYIKDTFKEDFSDEIHDSNKYFEMAKAAEMMGNADLARGLYAMSHDEFTHADFIHDNLIDWGCEVDEKTMMEWHELKERIRRRSRFRY